MVVLGGGLDLAVFRLFRQSSLEALFGGSQGHRGDLGGLGTGDQGHKGDLRGLGLSTAAQPRHWRTDLALAVF